MGGWILLHGVGAVLAVVGVIVWTNSEGVIVYPGSAILMIGVYICGLAIMGIARKAFANSSI